MPQINIDMKADSAEKPLAGRFIVEHRVREGAEWVGGRPIPVHSKRREKKEFTLAPNTRLVVEGEDVTIPVYVREQNAAMTLASAASYAGIEIPVVDSLSPATAAVGSADITMTVTGTGFNSESVIVFNGGDEVTTFISSTSLSTGVKPSLATEGTYPVLVRNGVFESESMEFTFTPAAGALSAAAERKEESLVKPAAAPSKK